VQERLHVLASRWWKDELTDYNPAGLTGCGEGADIPDSAT